MKILLTGANGYIGKRLLYWYFLWPIHFMIFNSMIRRIAKKDKGHNLM